MVPTGNKAKHLSSVNHTTKAIHHHHHPAPKIKHALLCSNLTCSTLQNSHGDILHDFQQVVFAHRTQYLFFIIFERLLLFKNLIVTTRILINFML